MNTKDLIALARSQGFTIKQISEMTDINLQTIYNYNCGHTNLSKEKEEKIAKTLQFILNYND